MNTLDINWQQKRFLMDELHMIVMDAQYSETNKIIAKQLFDKLSELTEE